MRSRFLLMLTAVCALAASDERLTVNELVTFVQSSIKLKTPDKELAEYLRHVKLRSKLDDSTIEDLQGQGAGPKTVAILKELGTSSASLGVEPPPPPKPVYVPPPGPDSVEQGKILDQVRDYVMSYTNQLPNFICVEVIRRYGDIAGGENWRHLDTLTSRLSFFDHHEDYKLVLVDNRPVTNSDMEKQGGTISMGEFGSMMMDIFRPESETRFEWERWGTIRGRRAYVFSYNIDQPHSRYSIVAEGADRIVPAYRGLVFVDTDTKMVVRLTLEPYDLPVTYPVHQVKTVLDYDFTKIGTTDYMLPLKAVITSRVTGGNRTYTSKNDEEFRLYRRFGAEATITFEPEPLPDDKVKEKP